MIFDKIQKAKNNDILKFGEDYGSKGSTAA
jgi:hypothetical protein